MTTPRGASLPESPWTGTSADVLADFEAASKSIPLLMNELPADQSDNVALQALQSLIYDDSPDVVADNFKTQGNEAFKAGRKRYRDAIEFYSKGIAAKPTNTTTLAQLYTNRAAVNLELGNYRSVKDDCAAAITADETNAKAYYRLSKAHAALGRLDDALEACVRGLAVVDMAANTGLTEEKKRIDGLIERKRKEEEDRLRAAEEKKRAEAQLEDTIKAAGVRHGKREPGRSVASDVDVPEPSLGDHRVYINKDDGELHWPVMLLYPEFQQTDIIGDMAQSDSFIDHLRIMFEYATPEGQNQPSPAWDANRLYKPESLEVYFEVKRKDGSMALSRVGTQATLGKVLAHPQYFVVDRLPSFIVVCKDTAHYHNFLALYKK